MKARRHDDRQTPVFDPGDPALPVAGRGVLSGVRGSTRGRWRAAVLGGVHLAIVAHAAHFLARGRTLTPVEPSEAMYTLELGQVNAGFVFLLVALASTLLFGRFFCGWGCHLVALQDLCGWLMRRAGIRPRPLRSRALAWAPAVVALYLFAWPSARRATVLAWPSLANWLGPAREHPGFRSHFWTEDFWGTFPGPWFAVLTFLGCGFAAVYLLGSKGFCTYGCPYGALFGAVDRLSPARIVVSDACDQCAHCTVTCTSNVRVHEEVRRHGRVVDSGCMKCMDCVSVCPRGALRFAWARPSLFDRIRPVGSLGGLREVALASIALGAALAFRGLYDGPPLLLSVALGGMTGYLALALLDVGRLPYVALQNLRLKRGGQLTSAGRVFVVAGTLWLAFTAHSGWVQWHRHRGRALLRNAQVSREDVWRGRRAPTLTPRDARAARGALDHFELADRAGLVDVLEVKLGLSWSRLLLGLESEADAALTEAIRIAPERDDLRRDRARLLVRAGRSDEAAAELDRLAADGLADAVDYITLGTLQARAERHEAAAASFRQALRLGPETAAVRFNLGGALRRAGRSEEAVAELQRALQLSPADHDTHVEKGLAHLDLGEIPEAVRHLRSAVRLAPDRPESRLHLIPLLERLAESDPSR